MIFTYLTLIIMAVNFQAFDSYKIKYKIKIVNENSQVLINDCLITTVPKSFLVPKEEADVQFENLGLVRDSSLCSGSIKVIPHASAVLTTRTSDCDIMQQIRNARAANIKMLVFVVNNKFNLPALDKEIDKYPMSVFLPSDWFSQVSIADFNNAQIGIYGSMGDNMNGIALTGAIMFLIIIVSLVLIILTTIFFNKQHFMQMENVASIETKNIRWIVLLIPIMMVGSLLLLYFFYNILVWMFIVFFFLAAALSLMSLGMLFVIKFNLYSHWVIPYKRFGINNIDFRALGLFALGLIFSTCWIINRHNIAGIVLNNIMGVFLCTEIAVGVGIMFVVSKNFKALLALLAITLLIDGLMVYIPVGSSKSASHEQLNAINVNKSFVRVRREAGESLMEKVATGSAGSSSEEVPIRFKVPIVDLNGDLSTVACQHYIRSYSLVGFGDVILPGMFIVYILTFAVMTKGSVILYSVFTLIAYITGLVITHIVVHYTNKGQPALVFLLPSTVPTTLLLAAIKKDFMILWRHNWPNNQMQMLSTVDDEEMLSATTDDNKKNQYL